MSARVRITFRYRLGQHVIWSEDPGQGHVVLQRRYTERQGLGPVHEYLLCRAQDARVRGYWAQETSVHAIAEDTP